MDQLNVQKKIRLLKREKECMDLLSQGKNPVAENGNSAIPEDSILCHEKQRACFSCASRMLQIEIDYLELTGKKELPEWFTAEKLEYTANYIETLSQGRNPRSAEREALPEDTALNQEKLSLCFQYTADALRHQAERLTKPTLTSVMRDICQSLGFAGYSHFLNYAVLKWLVQQEYITQDGDSDLFSGYTPTPDGTALGMSATEKIYYQSQQKMVYLSILCDERAQRFLRDNVDQIMDVERRRWDPMLECLTPDWHSRIACLQEPVSLTRLVAHILSALPGDPPTPSKSDITNRIFSWMRKNGLVERNVYNSNIPTAKGESVGIFRDEHGSVLWTVPAQQFVLDNLNQIVQDIASGEAYRVTRWESFAVPEEFPAKMRYGKDLEFMPNLENAVNETLAALGCTGQPLPQNLIWKWLYAGGYYEVRDRHRLPTEKGRAAGLYINAGGYIAVSEAAQRLIADNMQKIVDTPL